MLKDCFHMGFIGEYLAIVDMQDVFLSAALHRCVSGLTCCVLKHFLNHS